jgi:signal transduction histidine kinase/ActR/RegA family two-component response regulator
LVRRELAARFGLTNAWLYVFEREEDTFAVLAAVAGPNAAAIRAELPVAPLAGDWLTSALRREEHTIVIPDARTVAGNPEVATRLDNRSVVNTPVGIADRTLGVLGGGTFGDEGAVAIDDRIIPELLHLGNLVSVAIARLVVRSRDESQAMLQAQLAKRQRLESVGLLAGNVVHDFHNLLTVIRANLDFVAGGPLTERQRSDLGTIAEAQRSASELTGKLLKLGRHGPPDFVLADVNEAMSRCLRFLQRVIPAHIQTTFRPAFGLPPVRLDEHQFDRVMMNLALNARDAMAAGGRLELATDVVDLDEERLRSHRGAKPGRHVRVSVTDTGVGMPPEVVDRIFEPFFTTKPSGEGSGLGLSVAQSIVEEHGGFFHCRSEVGVGSTFDIYLRIVDPEPAEVAPPVAVAEPTGGNERILVAEDQPLLLSAVARVLEDAGYSVVAVENGAQAVKAAGEAEFALHLLDAVMPLMAGHDVCRLILAAQPSARILFMSGYGADALPGSFPSEWNVEILPKPFDPDTLLRAVRAALNRPAATAGGAI